MHKLRFVFIIILFLCWGRVCPAENEAEEKSVIDAWYYLEKDEHDFGKVIESYVAIITAKPDSGISYYMLSEFYPMSYLLQYTHDDNGFILKYIQEKVEAMRSSTSQESGSSIVGYKMLMVSTYLALYERERRNKLALGSGKINIKAVESRCRLYFENSSTTIEDVLNDKSLQRFHPLCRMLRVQMLHGESKSEKSNEDQELNSLREYNLDYKYIVERYRLELQHETNTVNASHILDIIGERFDLALTQPIDKLKPWENPLPLFDAVRAANPSYTLNKRVQRLISLLNDNNDPPRSNRCRRTEIYYDLARGSLNRGEYFQARKYADTGIKLAIDQETKDKYVKIKSEIDLKTKDQ